MAHLGGHPAHAHSGGGGGISPAKEGVIERSHLRILVCLVTYDSG